MKKDDFLWSKNIPEHQSSFDQSKRVSEALAGQCGERSLGKEASECKAQADGFWNIMAGRYKACGWIMALRYACVNCLAVLPKEHIYEGKDTGDFREVEADTGCSILCLRSADGGSLLFKQGAGLGRWDAFFIFDKDCILIINNCDFH